MGITRPRPDGGVKIGEMAESENPIVDPLYYVVQFLLYVVNSFI